ncbi:hypothetical protein Glove_33g115 [Diversispora epigaea]|uniref:HCP-like protein n=1 Tax=Diversispora epigaea TaxID=1348612 RepID=A0A397JGZ0_9GLOM|nr:hypothetical protein Glove_33g115 [Diversispora epigaea]
MFQGKTNKKEWEAWMDNLIIEDILKKRKYSFYRFSEFQNIKRHRKLEIHNNILKFHGITNQENINNYMIILEYNSENILIHNGIIKFNVFGLAKIFSDSLSFLTNGLGPIQYMDFNIWKSSARLISSGYPPFEMESSSNEIYTDCWKHDENSPNIFQVVKDLSEIIIFDVSVEFEPPQSQSYNFTDVKLENSNKKNEIKSDPPFVDVTTEVNEISTTLIADMYFDGLGVEKNTKKAFQIYSKAADEGSHIALNCMVYCYGNGFGVEKNEEKAFELFLKSAEKGYLVAQYNVCIFYKDGTGISKDEAKGFQCFIKSARAGNTSSICNVGICYENDIGVDEDQKEANGYGISDQGKAFEWYKRAVENFHAYSQFMLLYIIKAIHWLNKAKENGNIDASEFLEEITNFSKGDDIYLEFQFTWRWNYLTNSLIYKSDDSDSNDKK